MATELGGTRWIKHRVRATLRQNLQAVFIWHSILSLFTDRIMTPSLVELSKELSCHPALYISSRLISLFREMKDHLRIHCISKVQCVRIRFCSHAFLNTTGQSARWELEIAIGQVTTLPSSDYKSLFNRLQLVLFWNKWQILYKLQNRGHYWSNVSFVSSVVTINSILARLLFS